MATCGCMHFLGVCVNTTGWPETWPIEGVSPGCLSIGCWLKTGYVTLAESWPSGGTTGAAALANQIFRGKCVLCDRSGGYKCNMRLLPAAPCIREISRIMLAGVSYYVACVAAMKMKRSCQPGGCIS